jgi:hypothetical protein
MNAISGLGNKRGYGLERHREQIAQVLDDISQSDQQSAQDMHVQLARLQTEVENVRLELQIMRNDSILNPYS